MSEQQRQHLSAFVDGEIDSSLAHATLSALESSTELKAAWEHYHLIGAAMRSEPLSLDYRRIAARVSERIAEEPVLVISRAEKRGRTSRLGSFVGAALAASAAFLAVFAVPQLLTPRPDAEVPSGYQTAASPPEQFQLPGPSQRWHVDEPELESTLDRFLVNHQAQSPASGMKGFLPYATVVGYKSRR